MQGERQVNQRVQDFAPDHVHRYALAGAFLAKQFAKPYVADLACGVGYGSKIMAEAGCIVEGVDKDEFAHGWAKTYFSHDSVGFYKGDVREYRSVFNPPNAVVSFETIEHVEDSPALVAHFAEMAPWLICSVPNEEVVTFDPKRNPFHFRHFTPAQFRDLLDGAGYEIVEQLTQYGKNPGDVVPGTGGRTLVAIAKRKT